MQVRLEDIRKDYALRELSERGIPSLPTELFAVWMKEVVDAACNEPTAMHLSTVDAQGKPSGRIVLLKGLQENGFVFYTNYDSRKGQSMAASPNVALTFFWPELERQVRIEGRAEKVSREASEAYFHSRPRQSQIGAHASPQSRKLSSREALDLLFQEIEARYSGEIPLPEQWGGYRVEPASIEFWQGRRSRLHDRILYEIQADGSWTTSRLAP